MKYFSCDGSGEILASKSIQTRPGFLYSLMVYTDGVNDVEVNLYDNNTENPLGEKLCRIILSGTDDYGGRVWNTPREYKQGIYADLAGTGVSAIVEYQKAGI